MPLPNKKQNKFYEWLYSQQEQPVMPGMPNILKPTSELIPDESLVRNLKKQNKTISPIRDYNNGLYQYDIKQGTGLYDFHPIFEGLNPLAAGVTGISEMARTNKLNRQERLRETTPNPMFNPNETGLNNMPMYALGGYGEDDLDEEEPDEDEDDNEQMEGAGNVAKASRRTEDLLKFLEAFQIPGKAMDKMGKPSGDDWTPDTEYDFNLIQTDKNKEYVKLPKQSYLPYDYNLEDDDEEQDDDVNFEPGTPSVDSQFNSESMMAAYGLSAKKARKILHDKSVHGKPLTEKQRRFFGWMASKKQNGGYAEGDVLDLTEEDILKLEKQGYKFEIL